VDATVSRVCTGCGEPAERTDRFCEGCGRELEAAPDTDDVVEIDDAVAPAPSLPRRTDLRADVERPQPCAVCGSDAGSADGFCDECGRLRPAGRDHVEILLAGAAAVTDRGLVRARNEDAYSVITLPGGTTAAVVCDGVASVPGGAEASLVACEAAADAVPSEVGDAEDVARRSAEAARYAVAALASGPPGDPPACTYVGAVVTGEEIAVAWVGDSRAYWIADGEPVEGSRVLTVDDSWAAEVVALGLLDADAAWADRRAHVITRWLAADAPEYPVRTTTLQPRSPGVLLLCSDGLWNHLPDPEVLAAVCRGEDLHRGGKQDLLGSAQALLDAALTEGGHDNTTLVLIAAGPRTPDGPDRSIGGIP